MSVISPISAGRGVWVLAGILLSINGVTSYQSCKSLRPIHSGVAAPTFSAPRVLADGQIGPSFSLSSMRGNVVILDFWATWCGPCKSSMPALEAIAKEYYDRGVRVVSVNTEGPAAAPQARRVLDNRAPTALLVTDTGGVGERYKVTTIPFLLIVDGEGVVRWVHRGFSGASSLQRGLAEALDSVLKPKR